MSAAPKPLRITLVSEGGEGLLRRGVNASRHPHPRMHSKPLSYAISYTISLASGLIWCGPTLWRKRLTGETVRVDEEPHLVVGDGVFSVGLSRIQRDHLPEYAVGFSGGCS